MTDRINDAYRGRTSVFIEDADGHFYPRPIKQPNIQFIQFPEPHVLITDWYLNEKEWYGLQELIEPFAEQAYLCYKNGYYLASIACSATCCELVIKYEYLRGVPIDYGTRITSYTTLGQLIQDYKVIKKLGIIPMKDKLQSLSDLRSGYLHYNPQKLIKQSQRRTEEQNLPLSEDFDIPPFAYEAYQTMQLLLTKFYSKKQHLDYIKECLVDAKSKMQEVEKVDLGISKELYGTYMRMKYDHIYSEWSKLRSKH
ncbi:MAG: hypothetical protein ABH829_02450 [archaeon]